MLGAAPPAELPRVIAYLSEDVMRHGNHTTTGLIGWRYLLDALSRAGRDDLAWAVLTSTTYPSLGFELLNPIEPATTLNEQWDASEMDQGMNSHNHAMMAGPTDWFYLVAAGLTQAEDSVGWSTVVFAPPAQLIMDALRADMAIQDTNSSQGLRHASASKQTLHGRVAIEWSLPKEPRVDPFCYSGVCMPSQLHTQCAEANSVTRQYLPMHLGCPHFPMNTIKSITFAEWGDGRDAGNCTAGFERGKCGYDLKQTVAKKCVGQARCTVMCGYTASKAYGFSPGVDSAKSGCVIVTAEDGPAPGYTGAAFVPFSPPHYDPCFGTAGWYSGYLSLRLAHSCSENSGTILAVKVTVPANSRGLTRLPLLGSTAGAVVITEGGKPLWRAGAAVPGVAGIESVRQTAEAIEVRHGSGVYAFERSG